MCYVLLHVSSRSHRILLLKDERDNVTIQELLPPGYTICQQARANLGGGIAIIYHNRLNIQNTPALHQYTSFEAIECDIVSFQLVKLI